MADVQEPKNALWRREEQLRRWDLSETNKESALARNREQSKIKFQDGCIFLAACSSGDKDEVERLLARGADINTANIDGLTALHQACIDDNLDMVQFLVERKADIDACDNEGWTALHATTSCGFLEIAKYLIEQGANVSAVNNDGELPLDIAEGQEMEELLVEEMETQGVDAEAARNEEEDMMLRDANQILNRVTSGAPYTETLHPKTGASALHIAAAKGYINVMNVLLQADASVNSTDVDGWTPLHAAAHWGQEEAARILVENFCDMEIKNLAGQTAFDVADADIQLYLEELKKNQATLKQKEDKDVILLRPGPPPIKRSTEKWANVELDLSISDIYNRNDVSSVTRMSVEEKDKVVQKTQEEERELRKKVIDEKDEEKRSESSADEASSSDSETENYVVFVPTEKQNEINRQTSISKRTEEPTPAPSEPVKAPQEVPTPDDTEKAETKPPPEPEPTPRIQDIANSEERQADIEADKENERVPSPKEPENTDLITRREEQKKAEQNQESSSNEEDAEKDIRLVSSLSSKTVLGRSLSLPATRPPSGERQAPGFVPKSITSNTTTTTTTTTTTKAEADPASWRAGLRKTGSSSAVPDSTISKDKDRDNLARSASSPWLAPERRQEEIGQRRPISSSSIMGDNQESKNSKREKRFNDFYSRYTSLLNPNKSNTESSSVSSPTTTTTTTTTAKTTTSSSISTSSTTLPQQSSYVPLSRRRQLEQESAITDSERTSISTTTATTTATTGTPTSPSTWTTSPTATSPTSGLPGQRRSFEPPKRDEERETERKAKAKRARESRRSTKGVTKEEIELAEQMLHAATHPDSHPDYDRSGSDDKSDKENKPEDITPSSKRRWDDKNDDDTKNGSSRRSTRDTDSGYLRNIRPSSTSSITSTDTATTTTTPSYRSLPYRSKYSRNDDNEADKDKEKDKTLTTDKEKEKEKEKEDPSQKSSAIRTRRKRENRRPTGKINLEDIQGSTKDENGESKKEEKKEEDRTSSRYSSRYSEPTSVYDRTSYTSRSDRPSSYSSSFRSSSTSLDKEIDYKKLYEEEKLENERLRKDVKRLQQDITDLRLDLEKARQKNESRSYDSSTDKRERRALERKLSELEEELKAMENLKADNARLKEENGALIRVISKLSK